MRITATAIALALVLLPVAWAAPAEAYTIVSRPAIAPEVRRAVSEALDRCIPFYTSTLKTPLAQPIQVFIYSNRDAFVQELQTIGRESPDRATRWGRQATWVVVGGPNLFILQERLAPQAAADVTVAMCSAVGLILQSQLLTERSARPHQWIRLGHGFIVAALALQNFGMDTAAAAAERVARGLGQIQERQQVFPRLSDLATVEGYQNGLDRYGNVNLSYFLRTAVDFLLSKSSHDAFVAYFKGLAYQTGTPPDPDGVFRTSFGMTLDQFQAQFDTHLAALVKIR